MAHRWGYSTLDGPSLGWARLGSGAGHRWGRGLGAGPRAGTGPGRAAGGVPGER